MRKNDWVRIRHMLDSATEAVSFARDESRRSLDSDRKLTLALTKSIEIIGEAAAKVTARTRQELPQVPWASISA